jgi:flagellar protein FlaG
MDKVSTSSLASWSVAHESDRIKLSNRLSADDQKNSIVAPNASDATSAEVKEVSGALPPDENMSQWVDSANEQFKLANTQMQIEVDEDSGKTVFFIKNSDTGEVIRQVPSDVMLKIAKNISDYLDVAASKTYQPYAAESNSSKPIGLTTNIQA